MIDMENKQRRYKMHIIGVLIKKKRNQNNRIMKSVIQENFPKMKDNVKVYIERAHSISEKN